MVGTADSGVVAMNEQFQAKAKGFLIDVESHIVSEEYDRVHAGYVCRVTVRYPERLMEKLRRYRAGPRVIVNRTRKGEYQLTEVAGVGVMLTGYEMVVSEVNRQPGAHAAENTASKDNRDCYFFHFASLPFNARNFT